MALRQHLLGCCLAQNKHAGKVQVQQEVQVFIRYFQIGFGTVAARICDQNVEPRQASDYLADLGPVCHVQNAGRRLAARRLYLRYQVQKLAFSAGSTYDFRARFGRLPEFSGVWAYIPV